MFPLILSVCRRFVCFFSFLSSLDIALLRLLVLGVVNLFLFGLILCFC